MFPTPKAGDAEFVSPSTSGRPVEKSTHLGTQALLLGGHLDHRKINDSLLPTPTASQSGNTAEEHLRKKPGREKVTDLGILVEAGLLETGGKLLPTPRASRGASATETVDLLPTPVSSDANGVGEHGVGGSDLRTEVALLPTPNTMDSLPVRYGEQREKALLHGGRTKRVSTGNLREEVVHSLLPNPTTQDAKNTGGTSQFDRNTKPLNTQVLVDVEWGKFEFAINRWRHVLGRPAPAPTNPDGKNGQSRLASRFVEWLMGLLAGWVTGVGLTRTEELKALGNGVVPQQAALAVKHLLSFVPEEVLSGLVEG